MPTLIRLFVILLVLGGLGYGAMYALTVFVEPREKEVSVRIPARDLVPQAQRDPLIRREIDTSKPVELTPVVVPPAADSSSQTLPPPSTDNDSDVVTLEQGVE